MREFFNFLSNAELKRLIDKHNDPSPDRIIEKWDNIGISSRTVRILINRIEKHKFPVSVRAAHECQTHRLLFFTQSKPGCYEYDLRLTIGKTIESATNQIISEIENQLFEGGS